MSKMQWLNETTVTDILFSYKSIKQFVPMIPISSVLSAVWVMGRMSGVRFRPHRLLSSQLVPEVYAGVKRPECEDFSLYLVLRMCRTLTSRLQTYMCQARAAQSQGRRTSCTASTCSRQNALSVFQLLVQSGVKQLFMSSCKAIFAPSGKVARVHTVKAYRAVQIYPIIPNLGIWCGWVLSFKPRTLYPRGKSPCYTMNRRVDEIVLNTTIIFVWRLGHYAEVKKSQVRPRKGQEVTGGVEVQLYFFFNLGARCGGWLTPRPGRFTPGKETRQTLWEAGWAPGLVCTDAENLALTGTRSPDLAIPSESPYRLSNRDPHYVEVRCFNVP